MATTRHDAGVRRSFADECSDRILWSIPMMILFVAVGTWIFCQAN